MNKNKTQRVSDKQILQMNFFSYWVKNIKRELGRKCTFCANATYNGKLHLRVIMINDLGGKDNIEILLGNGSDVSLITSKHYREALEILKSGNYEQHTGILSITKG